MAYEALETASARRKRVTGLRITHIKAAAAPLTPTAPKTVAGGAPLPETKPAAKRWDSAAQARFAKNVSSRATRAAFLGQHAGVPAASRQASSAEHADAVWARARAKVGHAGGEREEGSLAQTEGTSVATTSTAYRDGKQVQGKRSAEDVWARAYAQLASRGA